MSRISQQGQCPGWLWLSIIPRKTAIWCQINPESTTDLFTCSSIISPISQESQLAARSNNWMAFWGGADLTSWMLMEWPPANENTSQSCLMFTRKVVPKALEWQITFPLIFWVDSSNSEPGIGQRCRIGTSQEWKEEKGQNLIQDYHMEHNPQAIPQPATEF